MSKRVVQTDDGYALIRDDRSFQIELVGAEEVGEVINYKVWKDLGNTIGKRDKVKAIIKEQQKNGKIRSIRRGN